MKLNKLELRRQVFHALLGVVIVLGVLYDIWTVKRLLLIFIVGVIVSSLSVKYKVPVVSWFLKLFDREKEKIPGKGAMFFVLGSLIVLALFPQGIALAAILVMAFGDSAATLVGIHLGKIKSVSLKTLEGFFAGTCAGFIGALFFVDYVSAFVGSVAAMCFEVLDLRFGGRIIDDNLMVPLVAGLVMYVLTLL
ncbi:MAG: hypothetical protein V1914_00070 [archaeon]